MHDMCSDIYTIYYTTCSPDLSCLHQSACEGENVGSVEDKNIRVQWTDDGSGAILMPGGTRCFGKTLVCRLVLLPGQIPTLSNTLSEPLTHPPKERSEQSRMTLGDRDSSRTAHMTDGLIDTSRRSFIQAHEKMVPLVRPWSLGMCNIPTALLNSLGISTCQSPCRLTC